MRVRMQINMQEFVDKNFFINLICIILIIILFVFIAPHEIETTYF